MKNHKKIPEKTVQVLSCAMAVAVMILLMSGDIFMSKILHVNPNQDYPYDEKSKDNNFNDDKILNDTDSSSNKNNDENGENITEPPVVSTESNEDDYDVSFLKEINLVDLDSLIQKESLIFVFSGRSTCPPCRRFVPILQRVVNDLKLDNVYYLNQSLIKSSTEGYEKFVSYHEQLQDKFGTTPYFMVFQNGAYQVGRIGVAPYEEIKELVTKYL